MGDQEHVEQATAAPGELRRIYRRQKKLGDMLARMVDELQAEIDKLDDDGDDE